MINLLPACSAASDIRRVTSAIHAVPCDPGVLWRGEAIAVDAAPDDRIDPAPEEQWAVTAKRSGICGAVSPRVIALPDGGFRLYYTQILPRPQSPCGAADYSQATSRILSATSRDGRSWLPEAGVRLSSQQGGAGDYRVVSADVVPRGDQQHGLRMYFECCPGPQGIPNTIRSAVSDDGLQWSVEAEPRLQLPDTYLSAPRVVFADDGCCRLFCAAQGRGIISAISDDGGLTFELEPGIRMAMDGTYDRLTAFAPEIMKLPTGEYRMYYAGYSNSNRADILTAVSRDCLTWHKADQPVQTLGLHSWDATKRSEMCLVFQPQSSAESVDFRLLYESCDGTAQQGCGVWRIGVAGQAGV